MLESFGTYLVCAWRRRGTNRQLAVIASGRGCSSSEVLPTCMGPFHGTLGVLAARCVACVEIKRQGQGKAVEDMSEGVVHASVQRVLLVRGAGSFHGPLTVLARNVCFHVGLA